MPTYDVLKGIKLDSLEYAGEEGLYPLLERLREAEVSDVMLNTKPLRIVIVRRGRFGILDPNDAPFMMQWEEIFNKKHQNVEHLKKMWTEKSIADYALALPSGGVARVHAWQMNGFNVSMRIHPKKPKSLTDLIPGDAPRDEEIRRFLRSLFTRRDGLVVFGGEVRSGKTSLENALYGELNANAVSIEDNGIIYDRRHVWIIGDPIEFYHDDDRAVFTHVDIADRGTSQAEEIRASLRVPRSLVASGEMRGDPASTEATLTAALAGSLAVATGHFSSINDIVSRFSLGSEAMSERSKRSLLASSLQAIVNLKLMMGIDGHEHLVVSYIDFAKHRNLKNDLEKDQLNLNTQLEDGLRPMHQDLAQLVRLNRIAEEVAFPDGAPEGLAA